MQALIQIMNASIDRINHCSVPNAQIDNDCMAMVICVKIHYPCSMRSMSSDFQYPCDVLVSFLCSVCVLWSRFRTMLCHSGWALGSAGCATMWIFRPTFWASCRFYLTSHQVCETELRLECALNVCLWDNLNNYFSRDPVTFYSCKNSFSLGNLFFWHCSLVSHVRFRWCCLLYNVAWHLFGWTWSVTQHYGSYWT